MMSLFQAAKQQAHWRNKKGYIGQLGEPIENKPMATT